MSVLVSVIIPVYNRKNLVLRAVESVLKQTYPHFEVIVVDDGSTDGTMAALTSVSDSRFRVVGIPHCGMPGKVRNSGIAAAAGRWIAFLDSDDVWHPRKLEKQLDVIRRYPDTVLVHTRERWVRGERTVSQRKQRHKREGDIFDDCLKKCIIGPSTVLMLKTVLDKAGLFREDIEIAEDYELWLRVTALFPVSYVDEPLVDKYAGHGGQLSEKYGYIEPFRIEALRALVDSERFEGQKGSIAAGELARKCQIHADGCRKRGKAEEWAFFRDLHKKYSKIADAT